MNTIKKEVKTIYEINKSRFITNIKPVKSVNEAKSFFLNIKKEFNDATHNVTVYIIGKTGEAGHYNDDGEPSGTAGKPMLDVLLGEELYNTAVVVTRYFGGTLLGTGGLVRAYSKAVQEGLAQSDLIEKQYGNILEIGTDYNGVGKIQYLIGENKIPVLASEYTDKVRFQVLLPMSETEHFQKLLTEATNARASQEIVDSCYYAVWNGKILMGDELRG